MSDRNKAVSLVLSIFKGENFVNPQVGSFKFQIQAGCSGKFMETGVIQAVPSNSEPAIQSQLAWTFTRKEFRDLRTNREALRVLCLIVNEDGKRTEMGYAVMHVRDAFALQSFDEIEPSKAKVVSLQGKKPPWHNCQPKLHMTLHTEDTEIASQLLSSLKKPAGEIKPESKVGPEKPEIVKSNTPKKPTKPDIEEISRKTEKLNLNIPKEPTPAMLEWKINETEGFFELGKPSDHDDFYIVNITIISASNLHLLWNGRTSRKQPSMDDHVWQIRYKAYGCEITSDPFVLSSNDETKRTFVGDKATARIRANPIAWVAYLESSFIEFQVVRHKLSSDNQLIDKEVMGFSCAELKDLSNPNISELKALLEVNSEWGYPQSADPDKKAEIRVIIEVDAIPDFFADKKLHGNEGQIEDGSGDPGDSTPHGVRHEDCWPKQEDSDLSDIIEQIKEMELNAANRHDDFHPSGKGLTGVDNNEGKEALDDKNLYDKTEGHKEISQSNMVPLKGDKEVLKPVDNLDSAEPKQSMSPPRFTMKMNEQNIDGRPRNIDLTSRGISNENPPMSKKAKLSPELDSESLNRRYEQVGPLSPPVPISPEVEVIATETSATSTSDGEADKENAMQILPRPGEYKITIELVKFFLSSKNILEEDLLLTYVHPRFGMKEPVNFHAIPSYTEKRSSRGVKQYFELNDAAWIVTHKFEKFSEKIVNEPLTIDIQQFYKSSPYKFAFSMLPIGNVFLQKQGETGIRAFSSTVDILKTGSNVPIGKMTFKVKARRIRQSSSFNPSYNGIPCLVMNTSFSPSSNTNRRAPKGPRENAEAGVDDDLVFNTIHDLNRWKAEQEKLFVERKKEKERAYLRILAEENQKRELEREKISSEKYREYKTKEKEYQMKLKQISEQEEKLKKYEAELTTTAHKASLKHATVLENTKLHIHRMQEEHQIEVSSLQRRLEESESETMKLKGRLDILERKLEEKEELIAKLKQERYTGAEAKLAEGLRVLEQENLTLKREKAEIEKSRDRYKKQSQALCFKLSRLQDDLDKQVKSENETLRLQILASKEQKELKKERKAVTELSATIKQFKDSSKAKAKEDRINVNNASVSRSKNEEEIKRLNDQRNGLLNTGAYTQYDMVIKEMERRIVQLAKGDSDC